MGTKLSTLGTDTKESKRVKELELYFEYKLKQVDISIAKLDVKICDCEEGEKSGEDSPKLLKLKMIHKELMASSQKIEKKIYKFDRGQLYKSDIRKEFEEKQIDVSTLDPKIIKGYTKCGKLKDFQEMKQKLIKQKEQWIYEKTPEGKRDLQNQNEQQYLKFERERKLESERQELWKSQDIQEKQTLNKWGKCPVCYQFLGPFMAKYDQHNLWSYEDKREYNEHFKITRGRTEIVNHPWQLRCQQESLMLLKYLTGSDWVHTPIGGLGHNRYIFNSSVNYQNLYGKYPSDLILPPKVLNKSEQKRWTEIIKLFKDGTATRFDKDEFKKFLEKEEEDIKQMFHQHGEDDSYQINVSDPKLYVNSESPLPIEDNKIRRFHQLTEHYYQNNKSVYSCCSPLEMSFPENVIARMRNLQEVSEVERNNLRILGIAPDNFITKMLTLHYEVTEVEYLPGEPLHSATSAEQKVKIVNPYKCKIKGPKILFHSKCIGLHGVSEMDRRKRIKEERIMANDARRWDEEQKIKLMEHRQEEIRAKEHRRKHRMEEYAPDWARPRHEKYLPKPIDYWQPVSNWN